MIALFGPGTELARFDKQVILVDKRGAATLAVLDPLELPSRIVEVLDAVVVSLNKA